MISHGIYKSMGNEISGCAPTADKAIEMVRRQKFAPNEIVCPICGIRSPNGKILRGNFTGVRDTRINSLVLHINKTHRSA